MWNAYLRSRNTLCVLLGVSLSVAALCVIVRIVLISQGQVFSANLVNIVGFVKLTAAFSFYDLVVVFGTFAISAGLVMLVSHWRRARIAMAAVAVALLYAILFLAIATIEMVPVYRWPLTVQLIAYSRFFSDETGRAYIISLIPYNMYLALLAAFLVPVAGALLGRRYLPRIRLDRRRAWWLAIILLILASSYSAISIAKLSNRGWQAEMFGNAAVALLLSTAPEPFDQLAAIGAAVHDPEPSTFEMRVPPAPPRDKPSNVIFFVIESLAAQYLDAYGARNGLTPNFDRLLRQGVLVEQAYAHAPNSTVALKSMLTSDVPIVHFRPVVPNQGKIVDQSLVGVAKRHGLRTAFFASGVPYDDELIFRPQGRSGARSSTDPLCDQRLAQELVFRASLRQSLRAAGFHALDRFGSHTAVLRNPVELPDTSSLFRALFEAVDPLAAEKRCVGSDLPSPLPQRPSRNR